MSSACQFANDHFSKKENDKTEKKNILGIALLDLISESDPEKIHRFEENFLYGEIVRRVSRKKSVNHGYKCSYV